VSQDTGYLESCSVGYERYFFILVDCPEAVRVHGLVGVYGYVSSGLVRCGLRIRMRWYRASSISMSGPDGEVSFVMYLAVVAGEQPTSSAPSAIAVVRS